MNDAIRMQISAFVDGELPDNEADLLLRRMGQDAELRHRVAEYLAIGRALRGEISISGVERIHERVAAAIDDKPFEEETENTGTPPSKSIRPLAGAAIAATVALVAIFGLQQMIGVDGTDGVTPAPAVVEIDSGYTVPRPLDDRLRQYYLSHGATATENGANGINSRFVTLRLSEEAFEETSTDEDAAPEIEADEPPAQP
ncbi:MAG: sigma-E factor negative regulatory protein [Gammaproteobacteria bacterium]|nr:sigma-E factor negative regulatory protein [Gammaproteobacteria bacterium]MDH3363708.1 sigma-E factor negative regulatory protein [Gammaproteobacteria bacterium]MDH3482202.1 sigma-E factor negative regulatory protein [Gammaproteobacteria bacterium]